jgi:hypothetical protein
MRSSRSATTRAKPACAISSARSARCCATWPCGLPKAATGPSTWTRPPLREILGAPRKFENEVALRTSSAGRGDRARVDAGRRRHPVHRGHRVPGNGKLILTGQLGDVMKESAQAALTLVKSKGLGRRPDLRTPSARRWPDDVHVHVPAGAIPKDGPSAGVAMLLRSCRCSPGKTGTQRRGHDRRDQPARTGAADRRREGEDRRGTRGVW